MAAPLECFLFDPIPDGHFPVYDVDPDVEAYAAFEGRVIPLPKKDGRVVAPIAVMSDEELDDMAWNLLLRSVNDKVPDRPAAVLRFLAEDLVLWDLVERGGVTLAVSSPTYFARRPCTGGMQGLVVFNPRAVLLIEAGQSST
jgi:hypothetical protein